MFSSQGNVDFYQHRSPPGVNGREPNGIDSGSGLFHLSGTGRQAITRSRFFGRSLRKEKWDDARCPNGRRRSELPRHGGEEAPGQKPAKIRVIITIEPEPAREAGDPRPRADPQETLLKAVESLRPYLLRLASSELGADLRPKGDASDLVQQTYLEAHRDIDRYAGRTEAELQAWLRQILINNLKHFARQYRESAKRQVGREIPIERLRLAPDRPCDLSDDTTSPSGHAIRREHSEAVENEALSELSDRSLHVVRLEVPGRAHLPGDRQQARLLGRGRPQARSSARLKRLRRTLARSRTTSPRRSLRPGEGRRSDRGPPGTRRAARSSSARPGPRPGSSCGTPPRPSPGRCRAAGAAGRARTPCAASPSGQVAIRPIGSTALTTSRIVSSSGAFASVIPPPSPRCECTTPARTSPCKHLRQVRLRHPRRRRDLVRRPRLRGLARQVDHRPQGVFDRLREHRPPLRSRNWILTSNLRPLSSSETGQS